MDPLAELRSLGAALGGATWVQGPGGNVSVKTDGHVWVKASGTRLSQIGTNIAVVPQAWVLSALDGDTDADRRLFSISPRPSLETYFHGLGSSVVAHTHPVGTLLAACSTLADTIGLERVHYERPGLKLARAVREKLGSNRSERALLLESHGLIVFADSAEAAIRITRQVDAALSAGFTATTDFETYLAEFTREPIVALLGGVGRSLPDRVKSEARYLFPDAVVYASHYLVPDLSPATVTEAVKQLGRPAILVTPFGKRFAVAGHQEQLSFVGEVAAAHDWVEDVLTDAKCARYLQGDEPAKILNLPSEQYRLQLHTKESTTC